MESVLEGTLMNELSPVSLLKNGASPEVNPVRTAENWSEMREAVLRDPGAFHGQIAAETLHWFVPEAGAWVSKSGDADGDWTGWRADTGEPVSLHLGAAFQPWKTAFDASDPPFWRWFVGGRTNACFNEVDRHVLAGHGDETALIFEGDRWDMAAEGGRGAPVDCFPVSRKQLLLEVAKCALALQALGLKPGDRIVLNMPSIVPQIYWTEAAKRLGIVYTAVFGGFSDKTLSDRIDDAGARVVVTSDGSYRNAQVQDRLHRSGAR
jgi:acrylyl-CoA reductase (NADPH)/3-hydroxypropionyl-CoA dehydratase/3-hydroxypropionyl-CoA synthetase